MFWEPPVHFQIVGMGDAWPTEFTKPLVRYFWTVVAVAFLMIGLVGIYVPVVPTTGPVLLALFLLSKANPALQQRLRRYQILEQYFGLLEGSVPFSPKMRRTALIAMWLSIAASSLVIVTCCAANSLALGGCIAGGLIGSLVILRFRSLPQGA